MDDLASIAAHLNGSAAPATAGLICGNPRHQVRRVLFAVEATREVIDETIAAGADLLVTLTPPADTGLVGEDGAGLRRLIRADAALYAVDLAADDVVSEAMSAVLNLGSPRPLRPAETSEYAMLVVYTPEENAQPLRAALAEAGAGAIGDYTGCAWSVTGTGEFTPQGGADPTIGEVGTHEQVRERRLEMVVPLPLLAGVTAALRRAHPYEEPAFSFLPALPPLSRRGQGRVGRLEEPMTVAELSRHLASRLIGHLPDTSLRITDSGREVEHVAISAWPSAETVRAAGGAGADVLITADATADLLRESHERGIALVDAPRARLFWPALPRISRCLATATGGEVETIVSALVGPTWEHE